MSYLLYQQMMKAANDGNKDGHNPFLIIVHICVIVGIMIK